MDINMATRRRRIMKRAMNEIWVAKTGSTADRDTMCDTWPNDHNINESYLGACCPKLKKDIMG
jgi:hypothetical protein